MATLGITIACPYCQRHGKQPCRCKQFRDTGATNGHRVPADQIGAAVRMFYSGMSHKQSSEAMEQMYDIPEPSKRAIYLWVKKYTDEAVEQIKGHKAHVGDEWVAGSWPLARGASRCGYSM